MDEKDFITQQPAPDAGEPGSSSPSDAPVTAPVVADSAAEPVTECSAEGADGTAAEGVASPAAKQSVGVKFVGFLKYLFGINLKGYVVPGGEKFSYYFYFTGQNVIYSLVAYNLMTFLLLQGVDPALSATVLICVKVWDAINDAVFGTIFDKVKFKSGNKFMPWLRISVALIPIATILLFCLPADIPGGGKLAWLAVFYVLWDTAYTLCDAPLYGSITVLTGNLGERDKMLSVKGIFASAGGGLASLVVMILLSEAVGSNYVVIAVVLGIIAFATMLPFCIKGKERVSNLPPEQSFTIRRMLKYLFSNKYLLIYYLAFLFSSGMNMMVSLQLFTSFYVFGNSLFATVVMLVSTIPSLIFALLVPALIKKFNKITLYRFCLLAQVVISFIIFFAAYKNFVVYIILSVLNCVPAAVSAILLFMFTPDCAEYGRFKTGIEAKGITFSLQTFMAKLTAAITGSLALFILPLFGWIDIEAENFEELAALAAQGITQPEGAIKGLWFIYILLPAIGNLIAFVLLQFYKLKDRDVQLMADANMGKISREEAEASISCKL